ncbi:hypothetical protein D7X33_09715 [Butyricicoccus sp. 1XD8-22]|nr:hypothetical protein D7X33_09715 [Butyricicoccus sp. 1XD8-22]
MKTNSVNLATLPCTPRLRGGRRGFAPAPHAYAAGGGALPLHPTPTRRAAGRCPCTPRLRSGRRGVAPAPHACAAGGGALPLRPTPARRAAGLCPAPAGAFAPDPEMLTHLFSPAGGTRDRVFAYPFCSAASPPER